MKHKQIKIPIALILLIIFITTLIIVFKPKEEQPKEQAEPQGVTNFAVRGEDFKDWDKIVTIKEFPEYTGKGNLRQQSAEGNTALVLYTGVKYEDAKAYFDTIINAGFKSETSDFSLVYGSATAIVKAENSNYQYSVTYNEITSELSIKGTDGEL